MCIRDSLLGHLARLTTHGHVRALEIVKTVVICGLLRLVKKVHRNAIRLRLIVIRRWRHVQKINWCNAARLCLIVFGRRRHFQKIIRCQCRGLRWLFEFWTLFNFRLRGRLLTLNAILLPVVLQILLKLVGLVLKQPRRVMRPVVVYPLLVDVLLSHKVRYFVIWRMLVKALLAFGHVLFPVEIQKLVVYVLEKFNLAFRPLVQVDWLDFGNMDSDLTVYTCIKWSK